jgi:2-keto-4-pentenoate hydratase/2-oxohepta-3-ene-1,7-dioic acid hydratase in catechol pathway
MRLLTFAPHARLPHRIGLLRGNADRVVDLTAAAETLGMTLPFDSGDMVSLIAAGLPALELVREMGQRASDDLSLVEVTLEAPIPRPRKNVFCVGWNYLEHFAEGEKIRPHVKDMPSFPTFFSKAPTTVNGPFDPIPYFADLSSQLDWEVELAVVIGAAARDISEAGAMNHVFGFTVLNDVTWRDIQRRHGQQWSKARASTEPAPWDHG